MATPDVQTSLTESLQEEQEQICRQTKDCTDVDEKKCEDEKASDPPSNSVSDMKKPDEYDDDDREYDNNREYDEYDEYDRDDEEDDEDDEYYARKEDGYLSCGCIDVCRGRCDNESNWW